MNFALGIFDLSLLFATLVLMLVITTEILSPYYGKLNLLIDKKKLKRMATATLLLYIVLLVLWIIELELAS